MTMTPVEMRSFYRTGQLSALVIETIEARLHRSWPNLSGMVVVGFGFAHPFLDRPQREASRVVNLLTDPLTRAGWPSDGCNQSVVTEAAQWPLQAASADRIIMIHGLELCSEPDGVLDECRRVLVDGGRAALIVPNRAGLWSRSGNTPFGHGQAYSPRALSSLIERHRLVLRHLSAALFAPPGRHGFWSRSAPGIERWANRLHVPASVSGGIVIAEVEKVAVEPNRTAPRRVTLDTLVRPSAEPA